jgi:hypothetical protein
MVFRRRQLVHLVCLRHDAEKNGASFFCFLLQETRLKWHACLFRRQAAKYKANDGGRDILKRKWQSGGRADKTDLLTPSWPHWATQRSLTRYILV